MDKWDFCQGDDCILYIPYKLFYKTALCIRSALRFGNILFPLAECDLVSRKE